MNFDEGICLLGFGEVGQILAADLHTVAAAQVRAFDLQFDDASSIPSQGAARQPDMVACSSAVEAVEGCNIVISVVTASEAVVAARSVADAIGRGTFYVDMNSVAPGTRLETAAVIEGVGGRFVEAVVMSPIRPQRIAAPILLGGQHAEEFLDSATTLGLTGARHFSSEIGPASAAKMSRSVIVKGIEALLGESLTTARHYGVEQTVLESLADLLPLDDWEAKAAYMISRSVQHGARRAEEMREVARTVSEAGLEPWMSRAAVARQEWAASHPHVPDRDLTETLDVLLGITEEENDS